MIPRPRATDNEGQGDEEPTRTGTSLRLADSST